MLNKARQFLGTEIDNSQLVLFRMIFGFLCAAESWGAIMTGWVHETFIETTFTFTFIGFEWLNILHGEMMYGYFGVMGFAGIMIMLGWYYRISASTFFIMWAGVYLAQKSHYNNHYYLLMLMSFVMAILPAHKAYSLDVKFGNTDRSDFCPRVCIYFFIIQVAIIYVYASIHKIYPDWLAAKPIEIWFNAKKNYWLIGPLLTQRWFQYFIAYGGIVYDGIIVFLLLYKPTRKLGFVLSIIFNLANSAIFQIGIFPFLMIGLSMLYFEPEEIRKLFFKRKPSVAPIKKHLPMGLTWVLILYFGFHALVPWRHLLYPGSPNFTEEGHRIAWRMMLRAKRSVASVYVEDKQTGERTRIDLKAYMNRNQINKFSKNPDMIWQFAQRLKKEYSKQGKHIGVYVSSKVSLNGHPFVEMIDEKVDLASVPWEPFKHSDWIILPEKDD